MPFEIARSAEVVIILGKTLKYFTLELSISCKHTILLLSLST